MGMANELAENAESNKTRSGKILRDNDETKKNKTITTNYTSSGKPL